MCRGGINRGLLIHGQIKDSCTVASRCIAVTEHVCISATGGISGAVPCIAIGRLARGDIGGGTAGVPWIGRNYRCRALTIGRRNFIDAKSARCIYSVRECYIITAGTRIAGRYKECPRIC